MGMIRRWCRAVRGWFSPAKPLPYPAEWLLDLYRGNPECHRPDGIRETAATRDEAGGLKRIWINGVEIPRADLPSREEFVRMFHDAVCPPGEVGLYKWEKAEE